MNISLLRRGKASVSDEELQSWFARKEFTADWLSKCLPTWFSVLAPLREEPVNVLEIGSFEGRSAVVFLSYLPRSTITCIDTFAGSAEVEARFDHNVAGYGSRVAKLKGRAAGRLDALRTPEPAFDIVYLDADKRRDGVFALSALAWPLLRVGGLFLWDDLRYGLDKPSAERPRDAIKLFQSSFATCLSVLNADRQFIVRKTAAWPKV